MRWTTESAKKRAAMVARESGVDAAAGTKAREDNPWLDCDDCALLREAWDDGYQRPLLDYDEAAETKDCLPTE